MLAAFALTAAVGAPHATAEQVQPAAAIDDSLRAQFDGQASVTFWVKLHARGNLSAAADIDDWTERGEHVVNRLQTAADAAQAGIRALLTSRGIEHRSFWVANVVQVTGAEALAQELAARPEP